MKERQEVRAAAIQAAAMFVSDSEGTVNDVIEVANIFAGYIARGSALAPSDEVTSLTKPD